MSLKAGRLNQANLPTAHDFDVTVREGTATGTKPMVAGPLSITGPQIGIEDFQFQAGSDPNLTIAIGIAAAEAALDFGETQESSGVTVELLDLLGTFELGIHVTTGGLEIRNGAFGFEVGELEAIVPEVVTVMATGVEVHYDPQRDAGYEDREIIRVESASIEIPRVGVTGSIGPYTRPDGTELPGLSVRNNGFGLGTAMLTKGGEIDLGGILELQGVSVGVTDFGVTFGEAGDFDGEVFIASGGAKLFPGKTVSASIEDSDDDDEAVRCALTFTDGRVDGFQFTADRLNFALGPEEKPWLAVAGSDILIDTGAGPSEPVASFESLGAKLNAGPLKLGGEMRDFAFLGDGTFWTGDNFGVSFNPDQADSKAFKWPAWLPIRITSFGANWKNGITNDPMNFQLTVSAAVTGLHNLPLDVSGAVEGLVIDVGLLLDGKFPITALESFVVGVEGKLFGGDVQGALLGGILPLDADGNQIPANDETTPIADRVFFVGLEGGFEMPGVGGMTIRLAFSELGPLGVMITASTPTGILLEPFSGLTINDFVGGVEFFESLPAITDVEELRDISFGTSTDIGPADWLESVQTQVVAQYRRIQENPNQASFLAAFSEPMLITAGCTLYSQYTSQYVFNGDVQIQISTDGKFMAAGKLNLFDGAISTTARLYADLSQVLAGNATVLFLADLPDQTQLMVIKGKFQMAFRDADGDLVEIDTGQPQDTSLLPMANLVSPGSGGEIGLQTLQGRGYLDVEYVAKGGATIDPESILDDAAEFQLRLKDGAPVEVSLFDPQPDDLAANVFRYAWPHGLDLVPGEYEIEFLTESFESLKDGEVLKNEVESETFQVAVPTAHLVGPVSGGEIDWGVLLQNKRLTVRFRPVAGAALDTQSIQSSYTKIMLGGALAGLQLGAPTKSEEDNATYHYPFTGDFLPGLVQVEFPNDCFRDTAGNQSLAFSEPATFTITGTRAEIVLPSLDVNELNQAGYVDIRFLPTRGAELDVDSILDPAAEFTLLGQAADGVMLTSVSEVEDASNTFRYHFASGFSPGEITISFMAGTFRSTSGNTVISNVAEEQTLLVQGATATLVSPPAGQPFSLRTLNELNYFEVQFQPSRGSTLRLDDIRLSLAGNLDKLTLIGEAAQGVSVSDVSIGDAAKNTLRFGFQGNFAPGRVEIEFAAGAFADSGRSRERGPVAVLAADRPERDVGRTTQRQSHRCRADQQSWVYRCDVRGSIRRRRRCGHDRGLRRRNRTAGAGC